MLHALLTKLAKLVRIRYIVSETLKPGRLPYDKIDIFSTFCKSEVSLKAVTQAFLSQTCSITILKGMRKF